MSKTKRILLTTLVLMGLGLSIELCFVYYNANFSTSGTPSICAINDSFDCDGVAKTSYSQFFGVPLSYWGVFLYTLFTSLIFADKLKNIRFLKFFEVFKNPLSYLFTIGSFSFCVSMCLLFISLNKINSLCIFCLMTYVIDFLIAIIAKPKELSIVENIKTTFNDFIDALKIKKYFVAFVIVFFLGAGFLSFTTVSNVFAPQLKLQKMYTEMMNQFKTEYSANRLGSENAEIVIHEYMDFNCAGCFFANLYLHRIVSEFENVSVIQHNMPIDIECNPYVAQGGGHEGSCMKARYAIAAGKQNKYWQMGDVLFGNNTHSEKDIIEGARLIDLDIKKLKEDVNSDEVKNELNEAISEANAKGVVGTPTLIVGMRKFLGISSYFDFKQAVIELGGRVKSDNG